MALLTGLTSIVGSINVDVYNTFPWALILNSGMSGIGFYALRIILLTVCLKLILSPLDFFQRYKMRKNQLITIRLKPQMEKLEKAYGDNPKVLQQKQAELNKREGMSYLASCLPMIVTLVIFIWLWNSLRTNAEFKQFDNYVNIYEVYSSAYTESFGDYYDENTGKLADGFAVEYADAYADEIAPALSDGTASKDEVSAAVTAASATVSGSDFASVEYFDLFASVYGDVYSQYYVDHASEADVATKAANMARERASDSVSDYCSVVAQDAAYAYFTGTGAYENKGYEYDSFLWIKDIWSPDTPWSKTIAVSQSDFASRIGSYATNASLSGLEQEQLDDIVNSYDVVMARIIEEGDYSTNGFLVLPIITVALNILTQIITRRQQKSSGQDANLGQNKGCMTAMVVIMPVIMGYFAIMYCAAFTLYMVTNSTMSLLINLVTTGITRKMIPVSKGKSESGEIVELHGRPDPNSDFGKRRK